MGSLSFVEPQCPRECVQDGLGDARGVAALELGVVGDAHAGQ